MKRRRFLQIVAGAALIAQGARAETWTGRAFGADLRITAPGALPLAEIRAEIAAIEATFFVARRQRIDPAECDRPRSGLGADAVRAGGGETRA
ncbi:hypothetical protein ACTTAF_08785 [Rhodobacter capsulatus]|uniref:hypothetical protein n=1 Tax=Rhodobacter capsulatus TaxID=1061 RepID=UPI00403857FA